MKIAIFAVLFASVCLGQATKPALPILGVSRDQIIEGVTGFTETMGNDEYGQSRWVGHSEDGLILAIIDGDPQAPYRLAITFTVPDDDAGKESFRVILTIQQMINNAVGEWKGSIDFFGATAPLVRDGKADRISAEVNGKRVTISCIKAVGAYLMTIESLPSK